jgi:glycosyltransferase involved in cell wall biosynthesis
VVSTDVPGARELLGELSNAVVPIEQTDPLAHALVERLRDPERCEREGTAGRAVVERSHDWRQTAAKVADVYAALIRR